MKKLSVILMAMVITLPTHSFAEEYDPEKLLKTCLEEAKAKFPERNVGEHTRLCAFKFGLRAAYTLGAAHTTMETMFKGGSKTDPRIVEEALWGLTIKLDKVPDPNR